LLDAEKQKGDFVPEINGKRSVVEIIKALVTFNSEWTQYQPENTLKSISAQISKGEIQCEIDSLRDNQ
jgi:hypothetical protein